MSFSQLNSHVCHPHVIQVSNKSGKHYVNLSNLVYLEAIGDKTKLVSVNETLIASQRLKYFEEQLNVCFVRVAKSYMISLHHLGGAGTESTLKMKPDVQCCIPLSKHYREDFNAALEHWNSCHMRK